VKELNGYFAALPTPFSADGQKVAQKSLGDLAQFNIEANLDGLYVAGSTGEAFLMSVAERETVLATVAEAAGGKTTLIAHVGDPNPAVSAHLAKFAAKCGYDIISAVPPFFYGYCVEEMAVHYGWLSGQTDLPFVIYNFPTLSGVKWSPAQLAELLSLPNVVGVKNTCSDLYAFEQLRRLAPDSTLLHGFDESLLAGLGLGADGGIGSTYNVQASRILALAKAHNEGRNNDARALQSEANALIDRLVAFGIIPSLKFILSQRGIDMGECRKPFGTLTTSQKEMLEAVLVAI
jgi:N-acetylneuraminate lyase